MDTIKLKIGQNSISNSIVKSKYSQTISTSGIQEAFADSNLVDDYFLKGGYKVVSDITCRNNIPCEYRKLGMQVMVVGPDASFKKYVLKGNDPCSNEAWEELTNPTDEVGVKLVEDYSVLGSTLDNQRDLNLYFKNNLIALNLKLESIPGINLDNYYNKTETYSQTEINDFLSGKQNTIGYTPENVANKSDSYTASSSTTYASTKALVDGLTTKLDKGTYTGNAQDLKNDIDGKANISHTHDISSITNLQTSLNLKEDLSNKAIDFSVVNDILYPSVKAVDDFVKSQRLEVPFANATSVTINHNLDKLCSVTISLDDGSFALCDYYNIDNNNILVEFSTQKTGKIILI